MAYKNTALYESLPPEAKAVIRAHYVKLGKRRAANFDPASRRASAKKAQITRMTSLLKAQGIPVPPQLLAGKTDFHSIELERLRALRATQTELEGTPQ